MKEPKAPQDFIEILSGDDMGHKVIFSKKETELAINFFQYTRYYRFSIFPRLIRTDEKRTFTNVYYLYNLDSFIRERLHYFSGIIEEWLKTTLCNVVCLNYNSSEYARAEFYLDLKIYTNKEFGKATLTNFADSISHSKEVFISHHHKKRHGCIPFWVLMEELTFGQLTTFIEQLNTDCKNQWIDAIFTKENRKFIISWINVARYLRNMAAHYSRFYCQNFVVAPSLPKEDLKKYGIKNNDKHNLFVILFTEKKIISFFPDKKIHQQWNTFIDDLDETITDSKDFFDFQTNGFTQNWKEGLTI